MYPETQTEQNLEIPGKRSHTSSVTVKSSMAA